MVPTTLFKSVHSSSHVQSVPTCMNKPVNNHVQAGQLNHDVQACKQEKSSCTFLYYECSRDLHICDSYTFGCTGGTKARNNVQKLPRQNQI